MASNPHNLYRFRTFNIYKYQQLSHFSMINSQSISWICHIQLIVIIQMISFSYSIRRYSNTDDTKGKGGDKLVDCKEENKKIYLNEKKMWMKKRWCALGGISRTKRCFGFDKNRFDVIMHNEVLNTAQRMMIFIRLMSQQIEENIIFIQLFYSDEFEENKDRKIR